MSGLKAFFAKNAIQPENIKYVASKRFLNEKKKPLQWELRALTSEEDEQLREECMKRVRIKGRRGQFTEELNLNQYVGKLGAACTVFPNLKDKELQDSYGVMDPDVLLKKMLLPGEYADYLKQVQEINGFDESFEEQVDEVKNS